MDETVVQPAVIVALQQATVQGIVAIAGIVGTLVGALIGAGVTLWVQKNQREHEDRTRFHAERLKNYAEFTDACQKVMAAVTLGHGLGDTFGTLTRSFETVRLIASAPVRDAANLVHTIVGRSTSSVVGVPVRPQPMPADFNPAMRALLEAMRAEMSVD